MADGRSRWRWGVLPGEILGNLAGNWRRHLATLPLLAVTFGAVAVVEYRAAARALTADDRLAAAGRDVIVVSSADPNAPPAIPAARCGHLNELPHVLAAGGLTPLGVTEVGESPATPVRLFGATGRINTVLDPDSQDVAGGGWISATLAQQIGVRQHESITVHDTLIQVAHFQPGDRHPLADVMVVASNRSEYVQECWFEAAAGAVAEAEGVALAALTSDTTLAARSALDVDAHTVDPVGDYRDRSTRQLWLVAALTLALPLVVTLWFGRAASALYRSLGIGRPFLTLVLTAELLWIISLGCAYGLAVGRIVVTIDPAFTNEAWAAGVRSVWLTTAATSALLALVTALAGRGRIADQLKDR